MIRKFYDNCPPLQWMWRKYIFLKKSYQIRTDPRPIINSEYKAVFGKNINWNAPRDLIEKIDWLQVYSDTSLWSKCADKYAVREFVTERGCKETLNELYGKWDKPEDIDWESLPKSFVMKTNNSCGQLLIVPNKDNLDRGKVIADLKEWMRTPYGFYNAQLHYMKIKPCIIAEQLLIDTKTRGASLVDYKIWCFHGEPECILVAYDRGKDHYSLSMFDTQWNNISNIALNNESEHYQGKDFEKPVSFEKMLNYARKLSEGFPEVRVDFYEIDGRPIFGELTFTTGFGSYKTEFYEYLGSKVNLDKVKKLSKKNVYRP